MKIGIYGYGRLGVGIEMAARRIRDVEPIAVFSGRPSETVHTLSALPVLPLDSASEYVEKIDVMLIAHGSAHDVPNDTPALSRLFHTVDAFDTHVMMSEHIARTDAAARETGHTAIIGCGWDPGLLSVFRLTADAVFFGGCISTFWGPGISEGHSDAIRSIPGVIDAVEITVPDREARLLAARGITLSDTDRHCRECYVACADEDRERIGYEIREMPAYFKGYRTEIHFVSAEQVREHRASLPHKGEVLATSLTGVYQEHRHEMRFSLSLDSNPEFTALAMIAYARAALVFAEKGHFGAYTPLDVPPSALSPRDRKDQIRFL